MSTTYYALRRPIVRVESVDGLSSTYDALALDDMVCARVHYSCLHLLADRDVKVAHRSGGTTAVYASGTDATQAISDYGELVTLGQLRRGEAP